MLFLSWYSYDGLYYDGKRVNSYSNKPAGFDNLITHKPPSLIMTQCDQILLYIILIFNGVNLI